MNITKFALVTRDLELQLEFYRDTLGLQAEIKNQELHIAIGSTQLIFSQAPESWDGSYHFAFNIPENQLAQGRLWLEERVNLISDSEGVQEFNFENWNAHSVYAYDIDGNIIELIARHSLKNSSPTEFTATSLLNISEIGIVSKDVVATAKSLSEQYGVHPFHGEVNDNFVALGDDNGLFIVVQEGREWFPDTEVDAEIGPVQLEFEHPSGQHFQFNC